MHDNSIFLTLSVYLCHFLLSDSVPLSVVHWSEMEGNIREKAARNRFMIMNYGWVECKQWKQVSVQKFSLTWSASTLSSSLAVPQRGFRIKSNWHALYSYYVWRSTWNWRLIFWRAKCKLVLGAEGNRRLIRLHTRALINLWRPIELLLPLQLTSQGIEMLLSTKQAVKA